MEKWIGLCGVMLGEDGNEYWLPITPERAVWIAERLMKGENPPVHRTSHGEKIEAGSEPMSVPEALIEGEKILSQESLVTSAMSR